MSLSGFLVTFIAIFEMHTQHSHSLFRCSKLVIKTTEHPSKIIQCFNVCSKLLLFYTKPAKPRQTAIRRSQDPHFGIDNDINIGIWIWLESFTQWVLLNRAPPQPSSIHLHPARPSSIHLHAAHFDLHLAHLSLHPALCNTLNVIRTKLLHVIGQFSHI